MQVRQWHLRDGEPLPAGPETGRADAVVVFGGVDQLDDAPRMERLQACFSGAALLGCSTAGEITRDGVSDGGLTLTALRFTGTSVRPAAAAVPTMAGSAAAGRALADQLAGPNLIHVLVLADGVHVNGSALVSGLSRGLPAEVTITGGLAGDGGRFSRTLVLDALGSGERKAAAIGFYGGRLRVGHASLGGWEAFGPIRRVTRSADNAVYQLDGKPAIAMYEAYLGDEAKNLPASGLLFPLALVSADQRETGLIRTLLSVDRERGSLTFAGSVPQGGLVRLMHGSSDRLIDAAGAAAGRASELVGGGAALALLVSCVGRRLLMGRNSDQEVEAATAALGPGVIVSGFYSNGEISPFTPTSRCELHNQTMTVTALGEHA